MYGTSQSHQEQIRGLYPDNNHCKFLKISPKACDYFPCNIAGVEEGDSCPNNPFVKHEKLLSEVNNYAPIMEEVKRWESLIDLSLIPSLDEMTPMQFTFASVVKSHMKRAEMMSRLPIL